jgi:hypothetical protein
MLSESFKVEIGKLKRKMGKSWDAFLYHLATDRFSPWIVARHFELPVYRVVLLRKWIKYNLPTPIPPELRKTSPLTLVETENKMRA